MDFQLRSKIALTILAGFVFLTSPVPLHAQTEPSQNQPPETRSDSEIDELTDGVDAALKSEIEPTPLTFAADTSAAEKPAVPARWDDLQGIWEALHAKSESTLNWASRESLRALPASPEQILTDIRAGNWTEAVRIALLEVLFVILAFVLAVKIIRGKGDVAVIIHYPSELRGTFIVRVSKRTSARRHRRIASSMSTERGKSEAGVATRFEHTMVSRETRFRGLRSRRYCVMVYGYLQPMEGERIIATHLDEYEVRVHRGQTERVDFDFHPDQCIVDVSVVWDRRPVNDAMVALREIPGSPRFTRSGPARMELDLGEHTLVVGSGDRVLERKLDITSRHPFDLEIDLGGHDNMLFRGCPPAVEPYLHGDYSAAARALEREGQAQVSHLILARLHQERGQS
jgi:hypothetical protein